MATRAEESLIQEGREKMKITAAVVREGSGPFTIEEIELDDPRDDEVLVRIVGVGLCHTDLVCRDLEYPVALPAVFGHEGAGVVEKVGSRVTKVGPGDHVVLSYFSCDTCNPCRKGKLGQCLDLFNCNFGGARLDGSTTMKKGEEPIHGSFFNQSSFASHALAVERSVVKVPNDVPLEKLGPLGCGFQTGVGSVINSLFPEAASSIAIFGMGSVGLCAVMGAVVCGCSKIIGIDINPRRLTMAKELGATHTNNSNETDPVQAIQEITGSGADYSLECTGVPQVLRQSVDALTTTGTCGVVGAAPLGAEASLDINTILFGRTVRGIVEGDSIPDILIPQMIELYKQGRLPFDRLITMYSLDEINKAADESEKGEVIKPILVP
jgi:aryl-alcohol dehydrogenase